jgi:hypothetical protein
MRGRTLLRDVTVNALLPYATYLLLSHWGVRTVCALAAGAVFPVCSIALAFRRERCAQALGVIVLAATVASIAGALAFTSPYLALAKGSLITGCVGLTFAASLLGRRPLIFHLAMTGRDNAARRRADGLWETVPEFRGIMYRLTVAWTMALSAEATLRLILIPLLPIPIFLPLSEAMWIGFFAVMMGWSWRYGRRRMAKLPQLGAVPEGAASGG